MKRKRDDPVKIGSKKTATVIDRTEIATAIPNGSKEEYKRIRKTVPPGSAAPKTTGSCWKPNEPVKLPSGYGAMHVGRILNVDEWNKILESNNEIHPLIEKTPRGWKDLMGQLNVSGNV